jgi:hypothetical protein
MMGVLTLFTTMKEKNYILFAVEKDDAGVVSIVVILLLAGVLIIKLLLIQ